jgi:hypothetical protein
MRKRGFGAAPGEFFVKATRRTVYNLPAESASLFVRSALYWLIWQPHCRPLARNEARHAGIYYLQT